jgi:hypothetical protein
LLWLPDTSAKTGDYKTQTDSIASIWLPHSAHFALCLRTLNRLPYSAHLHLEALTSVHLLRSAYLDTFVCRAPGSLFAGVRASICLPRSRMCLRSPLFVCHAAFASVCLPHSTRVCLFADSARLYLFTAFTYICLPLRSLLFVCARLDLFAALTCICLPRSALFCLFALASMCLLRSRAFVCRATLASVCLPHRARFLFAATSAHAALASSCLLRSTFGNILPR